MKSSIKLTILTVLILAVLIVLSGSYFTLEEGKQAIIVQFGRTVGDTITEAGLHFKLPFVQEVRVFEKRLLVWTAIPIRSPPRGVSSSGWTPRRAGGSRTPRSF